MWQRHGSILRPDRLLIPSLALLVIGRAALGSEAGLSGGGGHPRARFPLSVHAQSLGDAPLDAAVRRAVDDWNTVSRETLGLDAFAWSDRRDDAQVTLAVEPATSARRMGETYLRPDNAGRIVLPVRVIVFAPTARGETAREMVLYQIVAHELGHALGLAHTRDPRSLMCCVPGSIDFDDADARAAYVEARRHPDVRSVRAQLGEHYERFWRKGQ
jgi:hypothetical protein